MKRRKTGIIRRKISTPNCESLNGEVGRHNDGHYKTDEAVRRGSLNALSFSFAFVKRHVIKERATSLPT